MGDDAGGLERGLVPQALVAHEGGVELVVRQSHLREVGGILVVRDVALMLGDVDERHLAQLADAVGAELAAVDLGVDVEGVDVVPSVDRRRLAAHVAGHRRQVEPTGAYLVLHFGDALCPCGRQLRRGWDVGGHGDKLNGARRRINDEAARPTPRAAQPVYWGEGRQPAAKAAFSLQNIRSPLALSSSPHRG